jgi:vacuolar-type H+-ATPase subunit H
VTPSDRPFAPRPVASSTAERIAKIVEAAEKAASAVIDDAEAQARRYLEDAQAEADRVVAARLSSLSQLSDSLVAQAEAIRRQSDQLLASLGEADQTSAPPSSAAPAAPTPTPPAAVPEPPAPTPHLSAVEPVPVVEEPAVEPFREPQSEPRVEPEPEAPQEPVFEAPPVPPEPEPPASEPEPEPASQGGTPAAARLLATQMAVSGASREEIENRLRVGFEIDDTAPILDAILGPEG